MEIAERRLPSLPHCGPMKDKAGEVTMYTPLPGSAPPFATPSSARPSNGLAAAGLVLGVASLVAAVSFVLFPLALPGGLFAAILGSIAVSRGRTRGTTNHGLPDAGHGNRGQRRRPACWTGR
jgi:hypothetical protein